MSYRKRLKLIETLLQNNSHVLICYRFLEEFMGVSQREAVDWFYTTQPLLNNKRPIELFLTDQGDKVLDFLQKLTDGTSKRKK